MVMQTIGRRIRLGMIGGGPGSFIGETHRIAARLDGMFDIVAAALSSDPHRSRQAGLDLGIAPDRAYGSWREMIEAEQQRAERVDAVAIMTPNDSHHDVCMAALDAGFHVVCDKPLTHDLASARRVAAKVAAGNSEFCLTYCYVGYPMVRQARDMVLAGELGDIRQIHIHYIQQSLAARDLPTGWRMDPVRSGGSLVLMDIGTHAYHLGAFVTGLEARSLCADVGSAMPGRTVDDYAAALLRYDGGARGSIWVTNAAAGSEHGLSFRIHGDRGGLEWHQEEPNRLIHRRHDDFEQVLTRRLGSAMSPGARRATRITIGHPEGYLEAFANLYSEFAMAVAHRIADPRAPAARPSFPGVDDGVKGLAFVEAASKSARSGRWEAIESS
jgi:predicted dehydrogenase